ncbi:MAG: amidohydrolase family protein [Blastocatellia bacterium]
MKRFFILLCLLAAPSLMAGQQRPLVITNVTIIDATGAAAKPDMALVILGDRITWIGKAGDLRLPANAQVLDAIGRFLIPGLWDMHAHLMHPDFLRLFLANGITGVREMGGD